jgi:hypothetical protein
MHQSAVVNSLRGYYIMSPEWMEPRPITKESYWTQESPWKPEIQPKLLIKTDTANGNYDSLSLRFENGVLKEKSFLWD